MSLENQLETLNTNLSALVSVLASFSQASSTFTQKKDAAVSAETDEDVKSTPKETKAPAAKKETAKKAPAKKAPEPEPEIAPEYTEEEADAILNVVEGISEDDEDDGDGEMSESGLPAGKRDSEYFNANLRPICGEILKIDGSKLKAIARKFGCERISDTKPQDWDAIFVELNAMLDTAKALEEI